MPKNCKIENCSNPYYAKDLCKKHYTSDYSRNKRKRISVECKICGKKYEKVAHSIKKWKGACPRCNSIRNANLSHVKEKARARARVQVLAQGGIPNARKFSSLDSGENHHNWKGGITPEVSRIRHSLAYDEWRQRVFYRDDFICQICGTRGGKLEAHHIKPFALFPDLRIDIDNGQTLCKRCHKDIHKAQKEEVL